MHEKTPGMSVKREDHVTTEGKMASTSQGTGPEETNPAATLIDLQPPELGEN